jgi:hypothetical protein
MQGIIEAPAAYLNFRAAAFAIERISLRHSGQVGLGKLVDIAMLA